MPATTSRRPARYETPFGHGILDDCEHVVIQLPDRRYCQECGKVWRDPASMPAATPTGLDSERIAAEADLEDFPPLSGGSGAATAEAEVHHGDDYCPECDAYHEPIAPIARRCGPDDLDVAHEMGRCAFLSDRRPVLAPMGLSDAEWDAFYRGVEQGEVENHARLLDEAMRREVDVEMSCVVD